MMAISYGDVYVARVAMGANDAQVIKAFQEAEAFDGPSIIIAYCHCISHGFNLIHGLEQQKLAVQSGYWPLIRFNPDLAKEGKNPLQLDSKAPSIPLEEYIYNENRYKMLTRTMPEVAKKLLKEAQEGVLKRWKMYERLAAIYEKK
jgi:pyruvate-ferredoxin/flavodoxin oxidoreductase